MNKTTMLAAAAAGYVFGARAGRERYDQITATAGKVWRDPRVQQRKDKAADAAKQTASTAASQASQAAQQAAGSAKDTVQDKVGSGSASGTSGGPAIPSTNAVPDTGVNPGDLAPPAFPADPGQPLPGEPGATGSGR